MPLRLVCKGVLHLIFNMTKKILTDHEIDRACFHCYTRIVRLYPFYDIHIYLLHAYGLRIGETLLTDGIEKTADGGLIITMPKTGFTRKIAPDEWTRKFNPEDLLIINKLGYCNKRAFERAIKECMPYRALRCGDKGVNSHIFRHNVAKKLFNEFDNYLTVNAFIQEQNTEVVKNYVHSVIYYCEK